MCEFNATVAFDGPAQKTEAMRRFKAMLGAPGVTGAIISDAGNVSARIVHPGLPEDPLRAAAWVKDRFGMHPTMHPGACLVA